MSFTFTPQEINEPAANLDLAETMKQGATRRWRALRDLEHGEQRRELRAAGVSERRIDALYPYSFLSLIPRMISLISEESLRGLRLKGSLPATGPLWGRVDREHRAQLHAEVRAKIEDPIWQNLRVHLIGCLPISEGRESFAGAAVDRFHELCWYMAHEEELQLGQALHAAFIVIFDLLLVELLDAA